MINEQKDQEFIAMIKKIMELSEKNYGNRAMCAELGIKYSKLSYWKARMKAEGYKIKDMRGRPSFNLIGILNDDEK